MHLSPLTGIETRTLLPYLSYRSLMHLSPLTGIETLGPKVLTSCFALMHLSPLTGIETAPSSQMMKVIRDASFTPYGD